MELTLQTEQFKALVSKSLKGLTNNSMIALGSLIKIEVKEGSLYLTTTDTINYLQLIQQGISGSDFYVCISADQFGKLISKLTSETVSLSVDESDLGGVRALTIKAGTGVYKIAIPVEEGGMINYSMPLVTSEECETIKLSDLKTALNLNKSSLATIVSSPSKACMLGYHCDEEILSANFSKICGTRLRLFKESALLHPRVIDLLILADEEEIRVCRKGNKLTFYTNSLILSTTELEGKENYPVVPLRNYLNMSFESSCAVNKRELSSLIDRLNLFVEVYDQNIVDMTFRSDGIYVSTKKSNGCEVIPYIESNNFKELNICSDIQMLKDLIDSQPGEVLKMEYGCKEVLKLINENSSHLLSLSVTPEVSQSKISTMEEGDLVGV